MDKPDATETLLDERGKTHGDYTSNADNAQAFKTYARRHKGWQGLSTAQREALDMIFHKIARALNGNPDEPDHWRDISGYAMLVVRELGGEAAKPPPPAPKKPSKVGDFFDVPPVEPAPLFPDFGPQNTGDVPPFPSYTTCATAEPHVADYTMPKAGLSALDQLISSVEKDAADKLVVGFLTDDTRQWTLKALLTEATFCGVPHYAIYDRLCKDDIGYSIDGGYFFYID